MNLLSTFGPRMIYTSSGILDAKKDTPLEELQDNKLCLICSELNLKPEDHLLSGVSLSMVKFSSKNPQDHPPLLMLGLIIPLCLASIL